MHLSLKTEDDHHYALIPPTFPSKTRWSADNVKFIFVTTTGFSIPGNKKYPSQNLSQNRLWHNLGLNKKHCCITIISDNWFNNLIAPTNSKNTSLQE